MASQNAVKRIKPDGSALRGIITSGIGRNGIRGIAVDWAAGMCLQFFFNFNKILPNELSLLLWCMNFTLIK